MYDCLEEFDDLFIKNSQIQQSNSSNNSNRNTFIGPLNSRIQKWF